MKNKKLIFRALAGTIGVLSVLGVYQFALKPMLMKELTTRLYSRTESEVTTRSVYELLRDSPYPEDTYFWGLCMPWNIRFERKHLETDFTDGTYPGCWTERINRFGHYQGDHELKKKEGVRRVFVIADSHGIGLYTSRARSFPARLEELLKKRDSSIEVINGAMGGMSLLECVLKYEHLGTLFEPDELVMSTYLGNDVRETIADEEETFLRPIPGKGFAEMGRVVFERGAPDNKPFTGKINPNVSLELRTGQLRILPNQPCNPFVMKAPVDMISKRNIALSSIESFQKGLLAQGAHQKLDQRVFHEYDIFEQFKQVIEYCFWRLEGSLSRAKKRPFLYFTFLPSTFEDPCKDAEPIVRRVNNYLDGMGFPKGTGERDIEQAMIKSAKQYLKPGTYKLIFPRTELEKLSDHTFLSDFHYNEKGTKVIAEVIAEKFKF